MRTSIRELRWAFAPTRSTIPEAGLLAADDLEQLAFVVREGRVMVTQDTDFLRLHALGHAHSGIAYCHAGTRSVGQVIRALRLIWELLDPGEMANRVEYL
jgi:predicted nuclease of predicted toxin-antitoxin system